MIKQWENDGTEMSSFLARALRGPAWRIGSIVAIALQAKEMVLPRTWEQIEQQNALLRAMRAVPPGAPPADSIGDLIQKAANSITL